MFLIHHIVGQGHGAGLKFWISEAWWRKNAQGIIIIVVIGGRRRDYIIIVIIVHIGRGNNAVLQPWGAYPDGRPQMRWIIFVARWCTYSWAVTMVRAMVVEKIHPEMGKKTLAVSLGDGKRDKSKMTVSPPPAT